MPTEPLALVKVGPIAAARRVRSGAGLIPHRNQVQPPDRPLLSQLLQRRGNKHPQPLIRRKNHRRPIPRQYVTRFMMSTVSLAAARLRRVQQASVALVMRNSVRSAMTSESWCRRHPVPTATIGGRERERFPAAPRSRALCPPICRTLAPVRCGERRTHRPRIRWLRARR
jgi:hypothetical protein